MSTLEVQQLMTSRMKSPEGFTNTEEELIMDIVNDQMDGLQEYLKGQEADSDRLDMNQIGFDHAECLPLLAQGNELYFDHSWNLTVSDLETHRE